MKMHGMRTGESE